MKTTFTNNTHTNNMVPQKFNGDRRKKRYNMRIRLCCLRVGITISLCKHT